MRFSVLFMIKFILNEQYFFSTFQDMWVDIVSALVIFIDFKIDSNFQECLSILIIYLLFFVFVMF